MEFQFTDKEGNLRVTESLKEAILENKYIPLIRKQSFQFVLNAYYSPDIPFTKLWKVYSLTNKSFEGFSERVSRSTSLSYFLLRFCFYLNSVDSNKGNTPELLLPILVDSSEIKVGKYKDELVKVLLEFYFKSETGELIPNLM